MFVHESANSFHVLPSTWSIISKMQQWTEGHELPFLDLELSSIVVFIYGRCFIECTGTTVIIAQSLSHMASLFQRVWIYGHIAGKYNAVA